MGPRSHVATTRWRIAPSEVSGRKTGHNPLRFKNEGLHQVITYCELCVKQKYTPWLGKQSAERFAGDTFRYKVGAPSCWDATRGSSIAEVMADRK